MKRIIFYSLIFLLCCSNASEALISKSSLESLFMDSQIEEQKLIAKSQKLLTVPKKPAKKINNSTKSQKISLLFMKVNPALKKNDSDKYAQYVIEASEKFGQDPYVIAGIIVHESTVNNKAVSTGGDYGLMQVRWRVHEKEIRKKFPNVKNAKGMFDARTNILYGTEIFSECMSKTDDVKKALMKYSSGSTKLTSKVLKTIQYLNK